MHHEVEDWRTNANCMYLNFNLDIGLICNCMYINNHLIVIFGLICNCTYEVILLQYELDAHGITTATYMVYYHVCNKLQNCIRGLSPTGISYAYAFLKFWNLESCLSMKTSVHSTVKCCNCLESLTKNNTKDVVYLAVIIIRWFGESQGSPSLMHTIYWAIYTASMGFFPYSAQSAK